MPKKNERVRFSPRSNDPFRGASASRIGVREVQFGVPDLQPMSIIPKDFIAKTVASQLADAWVKLDSGKSASVVSLRRGAIIDFLNYLDNTLGVDLDILTDGDVVARSYLSWFKTLGPRYSAESVMPNRLSSTLQTAIYTALQTEGVYEGLLRSVASGPAPIRKPEPNEVPEFSPAERSAIVSAARAHVRAFEEAQRWAVDFTTRGDTLETEQEKEVARLLRLASELALESDHLQGLNPEQIRGLRSLFPDSIRQLNPVGILQLVYESVYPSARVLFAYRLLLMEATALSADEITSLGVDHITFDDEHLSLYVKKARAGKTRTVRFVDQSNQRPWAVGGLLRRLMAATKILRQKADGDIDSELWLFASKVLEHPYVVRRCRFKGRNCSLRGWVPIVERLGVSVSLSEPLDIRRIRKGKVAERAIALRGRMSDIARDDHSVPVFNEYYAHATSIQVYSAQQVVASQKSLSELAINGPVLVRSSPQSISDDDLGLLTSLEDPGVRALKAGDLNTGVVDCRNPHDSPFGPAGVLCESAPLLCLACPNALVFPSHVPAIREFVAEVDAQRHRMAPDKWIAAFGQQAVNAELVLREFDGTVSATIPEEVSLGLPIWVTGWDNGQN